MPRYKLIAVDIDGTLLDGRAEFPSIVREALRRALDAGMRVVLCTGRRYRTAAPIAHQAGLDLPLVCHSGALVKDTATDRTLFAHPMPQGDLERLLGVLCDVGLTPLAFTDTYETGTDLYVPRGAPITRFHRDYLAKNAGCHRELEVLWRDVPAPVLQVCTFGEPEDLVRIRPQIHERMAGRIACHLLSSAKYLGHFLEFQNAAASKWAALQDLLVAYTIEPGQVVAIGDDENDISMLRAAGLGVAMGNAPPAVKSAADVVTASNEEHGVARVLDKLLEER